MIGDCIRYGEQIGSALLAEAVIFFYKNAWKNTSTRSYLTGQRWWSSFAARFNAIAYLPYDPTPLANHELALAFFAAHLALTPSINKGTTVTAYLTHVRTLWRQSGCPEHVLESDFVAKVTKGICRVLPADPDVRQAFLLLDCRPPHHFIQPRTPIEFKLKLATILGFFGMLRVSAFAGLSPHRIILVSPCGKEVPLSKVPMAAARSVPSTFIGFFFRFQGKSTPVGGPLQMAYFPRLWDIDPHFAIFCPVRLLSAMIARGYFVRPGQRIFENVLTPKVLCEYIVQLEGRGRPQLELALVKTHSLRIGGHTYFTAMGMNKDLTAYLGRRKIKESSLRYFRASPRLTLSAIRFFFHRVPPPIPEN